MSIQSFIYPFIALLLHTGEVYMFGNGNHGQLGQGNNKPWLVINNKPMYECMDGCMDKWTDNDG